MRVPTRLPSGAPARLAAYGAVLAATFAAALGVGQVVGPLAGAGNASGTHAPAGGHGDQAAGHGGAGATGTSAAAEEIPGGVLVSRHGYTLDLDDPRVPAAGTSTVSFRILGPDTRPVTGYRRTHEKDLHLIAVRRDMTGYQHVHPTMAADGTWSVPLDLAGGQWRVFADFQPHGRDQALTLGADLSVAGNHAPRPLPSPARTARVDGYTVTVDGDLAPGAAGQLTFTVSRDGRPVTDLQPYLGAYGHLVVLRDGDLAYLHVHPEQEQGPQAPSRPVRFSVTAPSAGTYRMFLDFRHGDAVRTAEFTARTGAVGDTRDGDPGQGARQGTTQDGDTPGTGHADDGHSH